MTYIEKPRCGLKALVLMLGLFLINILIPVKLYAQQPIADFTVDITYGCAPLSVNFTNLSTQANSYYWNFGNGNTSTLTDPTTVYIASGYYTITLIAVNTLTGDSDTLVLTDHIYVEVDAVPDFTVTPLQACAGSNSFQFTNLSVNAVGYIWDFGDGNFSTDINPVYTYNTPGIYTVKLIAANIYGCTKVKTESALITIHENPDASFTVNQQSTCNQNQIFDFTATGLGSTTWEWDFGDGNTSFIQNPSHNYTGQGSFTVTLIVTNSNGCSDTVSQNAFINIGATLVPTFTVNSQAGCSPYNVNFTSTVAAATSWFWDFGDGTTSVLENPSHIYANPGVYDITLTVTTTSGCNGTTTLPGYITVDDFPVASFSVSTSAGCDSVTTTITNTSTGASSYLWDFGNGTTSTDLNPQITFNSGGTYNIMLTATSANGCVHTFTDSSSVTVHTISASFTATPRIGCAPLPVNFTATSSPPAVTWEWNFGDGNNGSGQTPSHNYTAIGNYTPTLIVTSAEGCTDTISRTNYIRVVVDSTIYTVPDTIIVCTPPGTVSFADPTIGSNSWFWDFGDGNTSTSQNPSHAYVTPGVYVVTLQTAMAGGCTQVFDPYAYIEVLPFDVSPIISLISSPCGPFTIELDNSSLNVATYLWDFGDGNTSTLQNPTHTYAQAGTYTISLLLTAFNGCQTSLTTTVTFGHDMPISISNADACQGDIISFSLNSLSSFTSAFWDFGDGNTSNQLEPSHIYNATGTYLVTVTITDTDGCVFTFEHPSPVLISNPVPSFVVNQPTSGCTHFLVQFTNTSTGASSYVWDFGHGTNSTLHSPSHNYNIAGVYTVTLTATENGCTKSVTMPNLITANQAVANFTFTPATGCLPITVTFTDQSVNPVSWSWNFGDGNTSTLQNPVHIYTTVPTTVISLTIIDTNGCTRTRTRSNINPVIPNIMVNDSVGCRPLLVQFTTTTTAATYIWDFGDGTISNLQNPSHLYTQTGLYTVTLTCILASGCTTITVKPDFISVNAPVSAFMSPTVSICAPSLVSFINQSTGATSWLWDFGDGTSSTTENPSHIYHLPGTYTVTLISFSAQGCSDTLVKIEYIDIPGTYSTFILGSQVNCHNSTVQFLDQSINGTSWFWNFGDGYTSTQQNPVHVYADTGSYTVTLITSDSTGCSSFYAYPNPVVIHPIPVSSAIVPNAVGCQPVTVSFTNTTTGATSYSWHFGNGDSTSTSDPSYTYVNPGIYTPILIAYSSAGCSDTVNFPDAIVVYTVPSANFTASILSGCAPLTVDFTNNSINLDNPVYSWDFGDGNTSALAEPNNVFTSGGVYDVTLIMQNNGGCRDTTTVSITVFEKPTAIGTISQSSGCAPLELTFTESSLNSDANTWYFGDGNSSNDQIATHVYSTPGTYIPYLVASTNDGCSDTLYFVNPVEVHPVPLAAFSVNQNAGCPGSSFVLSNLSTSLSGNTFQWTIGSINSTLENPSVVLNTTGFYDVTLVVTSAFGCIDSLTQANYIQVYDTLPPPVSPILSVSVLNNTSVEIIWTNNAAIDLGAYVLYRLNTTTNVYEEIYRDNNPQNAAIAVSSSYIDQGLNTLQQVYTYKLQTEDRCAYKMPMSALIAHTTINITAVPENMDIRVTWTRYRGCPVATYELSRVNLVTGSATLLASLGPGTLQYLDENFYCPDEYSYRVMATSLCGNVYTSLSDTGNAVPANILEAQKVDVVRSTVIDDRDVLTEWLPPTLSPERVLSYHVLKSTDKVNYTHIATIPSGIYSFIDENANVHEQEYYYRVDVINDCSLAGAPSNKSSSIFLQSNHKDDKTKLWWTPYKDWNTDVEYYIIEKQNSNGHWERILKVGGNVLDTELDE